MSSPAIEPCIKSRQIVVGDNTNNGGDRRIVVLPLQVLSPAIEPCIKSRRIVVGDNTNKGGNIIVVIEN